MRAWQALPVYFLNLHNPAPIGRQPRITETTEAREHTEQLVPHQCDSDRPDLTPWGVVLVYHNPPDEVLGDSQ